MTDKVRKKAHLFTLTKQASDLMNEVRNGRKSERVSSAIVWFFKSPVYGKERDIDGEWTGKFIRSGAGMPVPVELLDNIEKLQDALMRKEDELPPSRGEKGHLAEKWGFKRLFLGKKGQ